MQDAEFGLHSHLSIAYLEIVILHAAEEERWLRSTRVPDGETQDQFLTS